MAENKKPSQLIIESDSDSSSDSSSSSSSKSTSTSTTALSSSASTAVSSSIPSASTTASTSNSLSDIEEEELKVSNGELENEFKGLNCQDEKLYSNECNKFLLKRELLERNYLSENENENDEKALYPNLNDKNFNVKIAQKKEFNDTKYDGTIYKNIKFLFLCNFNIKIFII